MNKMLTHDDLQYIEHCNKLLKETKTLLTEVERDVKQGLDLFLPLLGHYVNSMRTIQQDMLRIVSSILKDSKDLRQAVDNHKELALYAEALHNLGEIFNSKEVQAVLDVVRKAHE